MISLLIAGKQGRGSVFRCLFEVHPPRGVGGEARARLSSDSQHLEQVPVDNRNLCRLNYRVAEATTDFYGKLTYTGGSFPPHVRASRPLVSPLAVSIDRIGRNLIHHVQWFSDIRDSKRIRERCPHDARDESVKRRLLGPLLFAV